MEENFNQIKSRIVQFADYQQMSIRKFCEIISVNPSNFGASNMKSSLSSDILSRILNAFPMLSPDWVLLEKGEMLRKYTPKNSNIAIASAPQATASNGDLRLDAPAQLLDIIAKQQDTIAAQAAIIQSLLTMPGNDQKNTSK